MTVTTAAGARGDVRGGPREPVAGRSAGARRRLAAAVTVLVVSWTLAAASVALGVAWRHPLVSQEDPPALHLLVALAWGLVGALLLRQRIGFVSAAIAATAIGSGVTAVAQQVSRAGLDSGAVGQFALSAWMPGAFVAVAVVPLCISARRLAPAERVLVGIAVAASVPPFVVALLPDASDAMLLVAGATRLVVVAAAGATAVILWARLGTWSRGERRGLGWLAVGQSLVVVFLGPALLVGMPAVGSGGDHVMLAPAFAIVFLGAAFVVASLGQGLLAPDAGFNRRVVSVLVFIALLAAYVFLAVALAVALPVPPTIAGVIVVVVLAIGFAPLRRWIERSVDAAVYGDAADPAELLRRLGDRLGDGAELEALAVALRDTLRLGRLEIRSEDPEGVSAVVGDADGPPTQILLTGADRVVGRVIANAPGSQRLDPRIRRVLEQIGGVLALAVQLAAINRELAETRERALTVGEEERRMVRRELHVGLAPALAAAAAMLDRGRDAIGVDGPEADRQITAARGELAERTEEVRDLARTLLPGSLDAGDLDAALRDLGQRFSRGGLEIRIETDGADRLDPSRQAAIHHIIAEAALLARRGHSPCVVTMRVTVDERMAVVDITTDAPLHPDATGEALASIGDRARELGGDVRVASGPRIHRITVELPR